MTQPQLNFIIVDDDESSLLICKMVVKKFLNPANIETFSSAKDGLKFIKSSFSSLQNEFLTILFLDVNMPVVSGWDFLKDFEKFDSAIKSQIKIYMLTSSIDNNDIALSKKSGLVSGYLVKPLSKDKILEVFG